MCADRGVSMFVQILAEYKLVHVYHIIALPSVLAPQSFAILDEDCFPPLYDGSSSLFQLHVYFA